MCNSIVDQHHHRCHEESANTTDHPMDQALLQTSDTSVEEQQQPRRPRRSLKILIVTSDLPSHPYAAAKLAIVLAQDEGHHHVTLAAPRGPALERCQQLVLHHPSIHEIKVVEAGYTTTTKQSNVRPITDPHALSTLWNALWQGQGALGELIETVYQHQEPMYQPLLDLIQHDDESWDIVIPIHSVAGTVCDAVEASARPPPCLIFSALPYDAGLYQPYHSKDGSSTTPVWAQPRSLVAFPHVSLYDCNSNNNKNSTFSIWNMSRTFWKWLDAKYMERGYQSVQQSNNERRARRGLPPLENSVIGYYRNGVYPAMTFGGVAPFDDYYDNDDDDATKDKLPSHVSGIGTLDIADPTNLAASLKQDEYNVEEWLNRVECDGDGGDVYVSFGTGTTLDKQEVTNLLTELWKELVLPLSVRVLISMRISEQERHRETIEGIEQSMTLDNATSNVMEPLIHHDSVIPPPPGVMELAHGRIRLQDSCPQAALLHHARVKLFLSHFGMGGFCEGLAAGVPMVAYPSGLDQYQNAHRAVHSIGMAVYAPKKLRGIGQVINQALYDEELWYKAQEASKQLKGLESAKLACQIVERVATGKSYAASYKK